MLDLRNTVVLISLSLILTVLTCATVLKYNESFIFQRLSKHHVDESPVSVKLYEIIEASADSFDIPKYVLYNVAYLETSYKGPFDWKYNPYLTSPAGAVGPMQIIPRYAHKFAGRTVSAKELKVNLKLNVEVSCKILKFLFNIYKRWDICLGYYNTGHPIVNEYANFASTNLDYKKNWIKLD